MGRFADRSPVWCSGSQPGTRVYPASALAQDSRGNTVTLSDQTPGDDVAVDATATCGRLVGLDIGLASSNMQIYRGGTHTLSISAAKVRLGELVELVDTFEATRVKPAITVDGAPMAMLIGVSECDSLQHTIFWLTQPNILEDVAQARDHLAAGESAGEEQIRARSGVPGCLPAPVVGSIRDPGCGLKLHAPRKPHQAESPAAVWQGRDQADVRWRPLLPHL